VNVRPALLASAGVLLWATGLFAQSDPAARPVDDVALVSTYEADFLRDLPTSDSLFALFETVQPSIISDRFSSGGLESGQPARLGGFLSSWTQTVFRLDGVTITDPAGSGTPLLVPGLAMLQRVRATTGLARAASPGTGITIDLTPPAPTERWVRTFDGTTSHAAMSGRTSSTDAPALARLHAFDRAAVTAAGPLVRDRLGAVFGASWTRGSQFGRGAPTAVDATLASAFSHVVATPNEHDRVRLLGWVQRNQFPFELRGPFDQPGSRTTDTAGHAQAVWERSAAGRVPWRASASYTGRRRNPDVDTRTGGIVERLTDGPVTPAGSVARETARQWSLAARAGDAGRAGGPHRPEAGIEAVGGQVNAAFLPTGLIGERVNGVPARLWRFESSGTRSERRTVTLGAYVADRMALTDRLTVDAGLRFESAHGSAKGAAQDIAWRTLLPRARVEWRLAERWQVGLFGGYARSMQRLALDYLSIGDPAAPTADVFGWDAASGTSLPAAARGIRIAHAGPGTGGDPTFSMIDPELKPPTTNEYAIGLQARPRPSLLLRLTGIARRERNQLGLTNVGTGPDSYDSFVVQDPGGDLLGPDDDQVLRIFDRRPSSFGLDRYVLTNPGQADATFEGLELTVQLRTGPVVLVGGATAGQANAPAASRGFGPLENDQTLPGELLTDPNATTLARGRLFTDRAYTAKFATVVRLPAGVRLGAIARYQDGQAFSRVLVFPRLNQGADAVRAFSNGESRFMFVGTLDTRLQKAVTVGSARMDLFLDAYNLLNMSNSVEENVAAPPDVRIATAVQPPRSFHVGVRVGW
jgi:hypothetical protein